MRSAVHSAISPSSGPCLPRAQGRAMTASAAWAWAGVEPVSDVRINMKLKD